MDAISNMLVAIVNAQKVKKARVAVPYSTFKLKLAEFLQKKGVVAKVKVQEGVKSKVVMTLAYDEKKQHRIAKVKRVSKVGRRWYTKSTELPYTGGRPGFYVVSTSQGLMDQEEARKAKLGGELIGEIWEV